MEIKVVPEHGAQPIEVDLGFLRELRSLQRLEVCPGVWHNGSQPSPLEPPFEGLPQSLKTISIDAWKPDELQATFEEHLGLAVYVQQRAPNEPPAPDWVIQEYQGGFVAYGSLAEAWGS